MRSVTQRQCEEGVVYEVGRPEGRGDVDERHEHVKAVGRQSSERASCVPTGPAEQVLLPMDAVEVLAVDVPGLG